MIRNTKYRSKHKTIIMAQLFFFKFKCGHYLPVDQFDNKNIGFGIEQSSCNLYCYNRLVRSC